MIGNWLKLSEYHWVLQSKGYLEGYNLNVRINLAHLIFKDNCWHWHLLPCSLRNDWQISKHVKGAFKQDLTIEDAQSNLIELSKKSSSDNKYL